MKIKLTLLLILFLDACLLGQKNKVQFEFAPYVRWDKYPEFKYAINPVTSNRVKINSTSWGINGLLRFQLKSKFQIITGLGFYKYSFNRIQQTNSLFGKSYNRVIDYVPRDSIAPSIIYTTSEYFYNIIALNIGIEKEMQLSNEVQVNYGFIITNYFTFSQHYHIDYGDGIEFKQMNGRHFGFSGSFNVGIQKKFERMFIGPALILPIFDLWKKDAVFPEEKNNEYRSKWLNGIGGGIKVTFPFNKKSG